MIDTLSSIGFISFGAACLIVGVRLLLLARKTRQLPEFLIGFSFVAGGAMPVLVNTLIDSSASATGTMGIVPGLVGRILYVVSPAAVSFVAWHVFRPNRGWAGMLVGALVTINTLYIVRPYLIGEMDGTALLFHPFYWITTAAQIIPWLWLTLESLHLYRMLRRQARIGLVEEPALVVQMLFWAIGVGSLVLMSITVELVTLATALDLWAPTITPFTIVLGLTCAACFWLAFFPPAWLERRLATSTSS